MALVNRHWLDQGRLSVYPGVAALVFVFWVAYALVGGRSGMDPAGNPLGYDFLQFWAVSKIGLHDLAVLAYDGHHLAAVEKTVAPALNGVLPWRYPPMFYLIVLPFSLISMWVGWVSFSLGTLALYVWAFCRAIRAGSPATRRIPILRALVILAGFGPLWFNLLNGQTGFLTAALAAGALLCLKRRPVAAGVLIGLLCIKPHLAVLLPLCLVAIGAWRAFLSAAVTVVVFTLISTLVLGADTLVAFLLGLREASQLLDAGQAPLAKMPSVFVSLRLLHAPLVLAYVVHGIVAVFVSGVVWRIWRGCQDERLRNAAMMTGTFFISPYVFDYDMVWLAFPVAWLCLYCMETGWRRFERELLVLFWADTLLIAVVAKQTVTHTVPLALGLLLWMIYRRATESSSLPGLASENHCS